MTYYGARQCPVQDRLRLYSWSRRYHQSWSPHQWALPSTLAFLNNKFKHDVMITSLHTFGTLSPNYLHTISSILVRKEKSNIYLNNLFSEKESLSFFLILLQLNSSKREETERPLSWSGSWQIAAAWVVPCFSMSILASQRISQSQIKALLSSRNLFKDSRFRNAPLEILCNLLLWRNLLKKRKEFSF